MEPLRPSAGRLAATLLVVLVVGWPLGALAAEAARPASLAPPPVEEAYRKAIQDGVREYDAGHFEEARSLFRRAHQLSPNARTHRGLGMTAFELRDYVFAVRNLSAALEDKRKPLTPEQRKDVQGLLDRSRMFVDVYRLVLEPSSARVVIDGRAPEFEQDGSVLLGFGTHTVEASAPEREPLQQTIEVRGGTTQDLRLVLAPVQRAALPGAAPAATTARPRAAKSGISHTGAVVSLWIAAGAAVVSGASGIYWYQQSHELSSCRNPPDPSMRCTTEDALRAQRNAAMIATIGTGAAAVTLGLIGILSWDGGSSKKASPRRAAVDCLPSGYGITCAGRF